MRGNGLYSATLRAARGVAVLVRELMPGRTATARENLRLAFGRVDDDLIRASYRHFAESLVDVLFFDRLYDPARHDEHFPLAGDALSHYRRTQPTGAVFVTGHFGNWELFGAAFRRWDIPIAPVVRPPDSPLLRGVAERFRVAHGQEIIPKRNALPLALKALRRGKCVAFLLDQAAGEDGIPVPFFGRTAYTYAAPAALALKLGVPLYAGYSTRTGDGIRYRCFAEHVPVKGDVEAVTRRLNEILESYVRACPEQWWWFHRRFKPPGSLRRGRRLSPAGIPLPE